MRRGQACKCLVGRSFVVLYGVQHVTCDTMRKVTLGVLSKPIDDWAGKGYGQKVTA